MELRFKKFVAAILMALGAVVFVASTVHALLWAPEAEVVLPYMAEHAPARAAAPGDYPARLYIPALSINAAVQHVGINAAGNMSSPSNFTDVGWYKYGPEPGQAGVAIIDGHVDNGLSLPGVFKHLSTIAVGDEILIDTRGGAHLHYTVTDVQAYPYTNVPNDVLFSATASSSELRLVTCDGTWVPGAKTYNERLVVFADEI
ncbi:MAG: class F sortase [Patescibacteria group bacterium]|nr:class F sortase [Patescibacteria group bacterium]